MSLRSSVIIFFSAALCCHLKALDDLLEIKNGFVCTEKAGLEIGDVLCGVVFCVLVVSNLLLEGTDGLGRAETGLVVLFQPLF